MTAPASTRRSAEHDELREVVGAFLAQHCSEAEVRRLITTETGFNAALWRRMADQLGLQGLLIPVEFGGAGYSYVEMAVVMEQLGSALYCGPYFATVGLATNLLLACGDRAAMARHLPAIACGEIIATSAAMNAAGARPEQCSVLATRDGGSWRLDGTQTAVLDGALADLVLTPARTGSGTSIFTVAGDAPGLGRAPLRTLDPTRRFADLTFAGTPAVLVGAENGAPAILAPAIDRALTALAAEQVGAAARCLDLAVGYARIRTQFGRPIGSFQAIKHICADMLVELESARGVAAAAATAAAGDFVELPMLAALAKWQCSDALVHVAEQTIQVHGGIGVTWEHSAHLYYRRAVSSELLLGSSSEHRDRLAQQVLPPAL